MLKIMQERSDEEVMSSLLSGEKLTQFTGSQWPSRVKIGLMLSLGRVSSEKPLPVVNGKILALQSSPPVAIRQLSFDNRQQFNEASSPFLKSATNSISFINFLYYIMIDTSLPFILYVNLI
jgi:hypothetical protein